MPGLCCRRPTSLLLFPPKTENVQAPPPPPQHHSVKGLASFPSSERATSEVFIFLIFIRTVQVAGAAHQGGTRGETPAGRSGPACWRRDGASGRSDVTALEVTQARVLAPCRWLSPLSDAFLVSSHRLRTEQGGPDTGPPHVALQIRLADFLLNWCKILCAHWSTSVCPLGRGGTWGCLSRGSQGS